MDQTQEVIMLQLLKELPSSTSIPAGQQVISFTRKSTEKNPVPDAEKHRYVLCPVFPWASAVVEKAENSILAAALLEVINTTASSILQAHYISTKATTIPASMLTWDAVLEELDRKQSADKLSSDAIAAWYDQSETGKVNAVRYMPKEEDGAQRQATKEEQKEAEHRAIALRGKYLSLASGNSGIDKGLAGRMLAYLQEGDTNHPMCKSLARRLEKIVNKTDDISKDL